MRGWRRMPERKSAVASSSRRRSPSRARPMTKAAYRICKRETAMIIAHAGKQPQIDATAWVAPDATVCGDVVIGRGSRIMHGARLVGEGGGAIRIGDSCIVMENAVIRASRRHPCTIGDHCLIGPNAHVTAAILEEQVVA